MRVGVCNMGWHVGDQPFNLPAGKPQVVRGHMGIVVPNLNELADRLKGIEEALKGKEAEILEV